MGALRSELGMMNGKFGIVSTAHLGELRDEINGWKRERKINEQLYEAYLSGFLFEPPEKVSDAKSIIVAAIPQGMACVEFSLRGESRRAVIPPTYVYSGIRGACAAALSRVFDGAGNKVARAKLPLKLLAVRSGLARYGRNNISYVEGMGSFHRLEAFYTDHDFWRDDWQEKASMDRCGSCSLCLEACPTGAISANSFLVDAGRCLTYFNENEGAIPNWVDPKSHNALVGCMKCQLACPENRELLSKTETVESFSEPETELIMSGAPKESLPEALLTKLKRLDMDGYYELLPRNLSVLFGK